MCRTGGPRCTKHAKASYDKKMAKTQQLTGSYIAAPDEDKPGIAVALKRAVESATKARNDYDTTTGGLSDLARQIRKSQKNGKVDQEALQRFIVGYDTRLEQLRYHDAEADKYPRGSLGLVVDGAEWGSDGTQWWYGPDRRPHRLDGPAIIYPDGSQVWCRNGHADRDDGPAIIRADGSYEWRRKGRLHRDGDLPADVTEDGTQHWYRDGAQHRDGDMPAIIRADGTQEWLQNGVHHRDGAPAITRPDGYEHWMHRGQTHRDGDLPAVTHPDGTQEWWRDGERYRWEPGCSCPTYTPDAYDGPDDHAAASSTCPRHGTGVAH